MNGEATKYEIINKSTLGVYLVGAYEAGDKTVTVHMEDGTPIVFTHNDDGQLFNDTFAIREVDTHKQADGYGEVEIVDGEVVNVD